MKGRLSRRCWQITRCDTVIYVLCVCVCVYYVHVRTHTHTHTHMDGYMQKHVYKYGERLSLQMLFGDYQVQLRERRI